MGRGGIGERERECTRARVCVVCVCGGGGVRSRTFMSRVMRRMPKCNNKNAAYACVCVCVCVWQGTRRGCRLRTWYILYTALALSLSLSLSLLPLKQRCPRARAKSKGGGRGGRDLPTEPRRPAVRFARFTRIIPGHSAIEDFVDRSEPRGGVGRGGEESRGFERRRERGEWVGWGVGEQGGRRPRSKSVK